VRAQPAALSSVDSDPHFVSAACFVVPTTTMASTSGGGAVHGPPMELRLAEFVDLATGATARTIVNPFCADPEGRLRRAAARRLQGAGCPDELELRAWLTSRIGEQPRGAAALAAAWDAAAPVASLYTPTGPDPRCMWYILVRRRARDVGAATESAPLPPLPPPQPISVVVVHSGRPSSRRCCAACRTRWLTCATALPTQRTCAPARAWICAWCAGDCRRRCPDVA
jgi:hypothetical protein